MDNLSSALRQRPADLLEIRGDDRVRFLNGYVTCDVKPLAEGQGTYGFVTEVKGHILADVRVLDLGDRLWLDLPAGEGAAVAAHLGKYAVFAPVEIQEVQGWQAWTVLGAAAAEKLGVDIAEPFSHVETSDGGLAVRERDLGGPAWTYWTPSEERPSLGDDLSEEVYERLRIEAGQPLFGRDFGPQNFPQESGLENTVSYEKGCYLGQEVIARIHYRGGVNRQLRGLRLAAATAAGLEVHVDGRAAGTLTSTTVSSSLGPIGLAVLHKRAEPGADVDVDGAKAKVVDLASGWG